MAKRIYTLNNYVVVDNDDSSPLSYLSKRGFDFRERANDLLIYNSGASLSLDQSILISDIPNWYAEDGVTAYTKESLIAFLTENTGFNGAGKAAALSTGKYLIGWQDFADSNTSEASPLIQSNSNGGEVKLTNNNNGTLTDGNTNVNSETTIYGLNDIWSTTSNTIVFKDTGIQRNDVFDIRAHLNISSSIITQDFSLRADFYDDVDATGNKVFSLSTHVATESLSAGVFRERLVYIDGFVGDSILNGSAELYLVGTKSFEVQVIGWNIKLYTIAR